MKKIALLTAAVSAIALTVGCIDAYSYQDADNERFNRINDFTGGFTGNIDLRDGALEGDIGAVSVDNSGALLNGYDDQGFAYVEVLATGDNGVAMNIVELNGGLNHPDLQDGFTRTFSYEDAFNEDGLTATSLGCSGDEAYDWAYDAPADETEIAVTETDEGMRIDYTSRTEVFDAFTGNPTGDMQSASGSFVIVN